uniref:Uncharacterized protein n=1 Tax=Candidatus Kentrum sp. LFY TaxID=2126342 RepID=A0A450USA2_9GAMM|nr:MAG: hypothetical protein BECKLFY1418A_GA0070994_10501 [Candidatus Kentron sp. LFY]
MKTHIRRNPTHQRSRAERDTSSKKARRGWGTRSMRHPPFEKSELVRLVKQSYFPIRHTLDKLGITKTNFYGWYERYPTFGEIGHPRLIWLRCIRGIGLICFDLSRFLIVGWINPWLFAFTSSCCFSNKHVSSGQA